ncbi:hypothetical protein GD429_17360 [Burkholderia sp. BE17]|nr:hypothetical protein [Burkholderia sp. BE17]MPV67574.1 hypothetical protein [Burkholderia sp. BE17]
MNWLRRCQPIPSSQQRPCSGAFNKVARPSYTGWVNRIVYFVGSLMPPAPSKAKMSASAALFALGHAQAAGRVDVDARTCGWNDKNAARVRRRALLRREAGKAAGDGLTTAGALPERPRETPPTITVSGVFHFRLNRC